MPAPLTERQQEVIAFVRRFMTEHGYPPTLRELGEGVGVSHARAGRVLRALEKKGVVRCDVGAHRGLRLVEDS